MAPSPPADIDFVGELLDARLDICLEPFGALVLGYGAQHLAQQVETLARLARFAVGSLCGFVFRAQVGGHERFRRIATAKS